MSIAPLVNPAGAICMIVLLIAQYPPLVLHQIQVSTQYLGASADVVDKTMTSPSEENIKRANGMIYMSSTCTNTGDSAITVTFEVAFDQDVG